MCKYGYAYTNKQNTRINRIRRKITNCSLFCNSAAYQFNKCYKITDYKTCNQLI
ncbi:hypothetical protein Hanom_Chr14g01300771 [Helianthus anomalus]